MIHNKTRIWLTWFTTISLVIIAWHSIQHEMNDVASACVGVLGLIVGAYTAGKTINNIKGTK